MSDQQPVPEEDPEVPVVGPGEEYEDDEEDILFVGDDDEEEVGGGGAAGGDGDVEMGDGPGEVTLDDYYNEFLIHNDLDPPQPPSGKKIENDKQELCEILKKTAATIASIKAFPTIPVSCSASLSKLQPCSRKFFVKSYNIIRGLRTEIIHLKCQITTREREINDLVEKVNTCAANIQANLQVCKTECEEPCKTPCVVKKKKKKAKCKGGKKKTVKKCDSEYYNPYGGGYMYPSYGVQPYAGPIPPMW